MITKKDYLEALMVIKKYNLQLEENSVDYLLPSKDEAISIGYKKATNGDYNFRKACRDLDHDLYYSGWMDCYDWICVYKV